MFAKVLNFAYYFKQHISDHPLDLRIDMNELHQMSVSSMDKFFNPNICHVCKTLYNENFITCDQCNMISYCSRDHKLINNKHHMQMCVAMQNVSRRHPQFWSTFGLNLEEWAQTRKQITALIKLELHRDLEPYEVQMITLAKSCFICHRQTNLLHCSQCFSINYCHDHKRLLGNCHKSSCNKLLEGLWVNIMLTSFPVTMNRFPEFPNKNKFTVDMDAFIEQFVYPIHCMDNTRTVWYSMCLYYSDYVSGPLTLYYGIRNLNVLDALHQDSCFVIHIIDANFVDREYLPAWELLLHLAPNIKNLKIILIGPVLRTESEDLMVCTIRCVQQSLNFETHRMLYRNYVDSEHYKRPNVIIGFQEDLNNWKILAKTILIIKDQKCPFLLTSASKHKAEQNVNKIKRLLMSSHLTYLVYNGKNNFNSLRPYADFEDGGISYRNKYLTVYKRL